MVGGSYHHMHKTGWNEAVKLIASSIRSLVKKEERGE